METQCAGSSGEYWKTSHIILQSKIIWLSPAAISNKQSPPARLCSGAWFHLSASMMPKISSSLFPPPMKLCCQRHVAQTPVLQPPSYTFIICVHITTAGSGREVGNPTSTYKTGTMLHPQIVSVTLGLESLNHH